MERRTRGYADKNSFRFNGFLCGGIGFIGCDGYDFVINFSIEDFRHKACTNARYALVELENIHHEAQVFEPIHRIVKNTDPYALLQAMEQAIGKDAGTPVHWQIGQKKGTIFVHDEAGLLPVGIVQNFLDDYMKTAEGVIDYIHGEDATCALSLVEGTIGLILPPVEKNAFFQGIIAGGTLPRKTFSMGHAQEKRYYLEARKIK